MFPPAAFAHVFPQFLDLRLLGFAVYKEVAAGLPLVPAALLAPVAQVVARRCAPQQELVDRVEVGLGVLVLFCSLYHVSTGETLNRILNEEKTNDKGFFCDPVSTLDRKLVESIIG